VRQPHVPERTCVACRSKRPKTELVRLAHASQNGVVIDDRKRMPGRGAYFCRDVRCWQAGTAGRRLERALRISVPAAIRQELSRAFTMGDRVTNG
jgi:uncharacterized protein